MLRLDNFFDLVLICEVIAEGYNTMVEVKEYKEYGWASICFMTDKFGGIYTNLHYDYRTGELRKNYGRPDQMIIHDINTLFRVVWDDMQYMLKHRDFKALNEFINDQY